MVQQTVFVKNQIISENKHNNRTQIICFVWKSCLVPVSSLLSLRHLWFFICIVQTYFRFCLHVSVMLVTKHVFFSLLFLLYMQLTVRMTLDMTRRNTQIRCLLEAPRLGLPSKVSLIQLIDIWVQKVSKNIWFASDARSNLKLGKLLLEPTSWNLVEFNWFTTHRTVRRNLKQFFNSTGDFHSQIRVDSSSACLYHNDLLSTCDPLSHCA